MKLWFPAGAIDVIVFEIVAHSDPIGRSKDVVSRWAETEGKRKRKRQLCESMYQGDCGMEKMSRVNSVGRKYSGQKGLEVSPRVTVGDGGKNKKTEHTDACRQSQSYKKPSSIIPHLTS
jgi:hypothetical protein